MPLLGFAALLGACAAAPQFDAAGADPTLTPASVAGGVERPGPVLWSGVIVGLAYGERETLVDVLGFPAGRNLAPDTDAPDTGRFAVAQRGYLDPERYARGRRITVKGTISGRRHRPSGDRDYPVVSEAAVHLWPHPGAGTGWPFDVRFGFFFSN